MEDKNVGGLEFTVGQPKEIGGSNSNYEPLNEDVLYDAVLVEISKENAPFGPTLRWIFELLAEEFAYTFTPEGGEEQTGRRRVRGNTSPLCNPKTKLYKWYTKLLGREPGPGEKINTVDIIGTTCKILIRNVKGKKADEEGNFPIYSNVDRIVANQDKKVTSTKRGRKPTVKKPIKKAKPKEDEVFPQSAVEGNKSGDEMFDDIF